MERLNEFVQKAFKKRDAYTFDFEADFIKMIQKISVRQLVNGNKKHLKRFNESVNSLYKNVYVPEIVNAGISKRNNFNKLFVDNE